MSTLVFASNLAVVLSHTSATVKTILGGGAQVGRTTDETQDHTGVIQ